MCIFGNANDRQVKKLRKIADKIELLAPHYASMSDDELRAMTPYFKERLKAHHTRQYAWTFHHIMVVENFHQNVRA